MRQGKASVLHKESGTESRAAHRAAHLSACIQSVEKWHSCEGEKGQGQRKGSSEEEDMARSYEQETPGWVCVGTLLFFMHFLSVTVSGGKI